MANPCFYLWAGYGIEGAGPQLLSRGDVEALSLADPGAWGPVGVA
ncbi:hypothetical protein PABY_04500 [Pyrodictium abyssi]|uniref:Uncharacterized protein n=1 Tax=Pyrodictium abyssi TaxID=54256 RepID=A0ABN6ZKU2_9CREN|nr:hypothetical protein PABY_04500 [Pyrodictium abyssi]